eukprot:7305534-Pyramimonas_sp.AAC.2
MRDSRLPQKLLLMDIWSVCPALAAPPVGVDLQLMLQRQCIQQQQQQQQQLLLLQQLLPVQQPQCIQQQPEAQPDPSTSLKVVDLKRSAQCIEEDNNNGGANKNQKTAPRWSPTQSQLQALEVLFATGQGTPNKSIIKDIAEKLLEYGPISDTNVYNWFQNRK